MAKHMKMERELAMLLKKLVAFKSTEDNVRAKKDIVDFCAGWFKEQGIKVKKYPHKNSPALLATLPGKSRGKILMLAHLDVVPGGDRLFRLQEKSGLFYGRGVIDDKGPAAMLMLLAKSVKKHNVPTVQILFTTDEEAGGTDGAERLSRLPEFKDIDAVFVPDGGDENAVVCKSKGLIHFEIEASGRSCHGSTPWEGENAIEKVWLAFESVKDLMKDEYTGHPDHWHGTVNIGKISGGRAINQVPDTARAGIDIRFTEKHRLERLLAKIKKALAGKARIIHLETAKLLSSDEKHPVVAKYIRLAEKTMGKPIVAKPEHGASDARHFSDYGVPVWLHYPRGGNYHGEDEWVDPASLVSMAMILEEFLKEPLQ